jgi:hypothetical protein
VNKKFTVFLLLWLLFFYFAQAQSQFDPPGSAKHLHGEVEIAHEKSPLKGKVGGEESTLDPEEEKEFWTLSRDMDELRCMVKEKPVQEPTPDGTTCLSSLSHLR